MRTPRSAFRLRAATALACSALALSALPACGGKPAPQMANVQAGEMPEGETWNGVYFHPVFGYLHVVEEGDSIVGRWKRTDQSAWGELSGKKQGNLLRYTWKEHKIGLIGPAATSNGRGYFKFKEGKEKGIAELDGQFGLDQDETGSDWHCVKQQRLTPDLKSINGDTGGLAPPAGNTWQ